MRQLRIVLVFAIGAKQSRVPHGIVAPPQMKRRLFDMDGFQPKLFT